MKTWSKTAGAFVNKAAVAKAARAKRSSKEIAGGKYFFEYFVAVGIEGSLQETNSTLDVKIVQNRNFATIGLAK